jgi:hypothetical protein
MWQTDEESGLLQGCCFAVALDRAATSGEEVSFDRTQILPRESSRGDPDGFLLLVASMCAKV